MNAISQKTDMAAPAVSEPTPAVSPAPRRPLMRRLRPLLLILGPLALLIGGAYFYVTGARYVSTDNAYVKADIAAISAEVSGRSTPSPSPTTTMSPPGSCCSRLDPQPFRLALAQAEAQLKTTRDDILAKEASYRQKQSEIVLAQENIAFYEQELGIYEKMAKSQIAAQTQLDEAQPQPDDVARQQLPALRAGAGGHPGRAGRPGRCAAGAACPLSRGPGGARPGGARSAPHGDPRARQRHHRQPDAAARRLYQRRHAGLQPGRAPTRLLGRGQLQGDRPDLCAGRARRRRSPSTPIPAATGTATVDSISAGHRRRVLGAAAAERHRQLGEGRAAHSRCGIEIADRPGRRRRCAPA